MTPLPSRNAESGSAPPTTARDTAGALEESGHWLALTACAGSPSTSKDAPHLPSLPEPRIRRHLSQASRLVWLGSSKPSPSDGAGVRDAPSSRCSVSRQEGLRGRVGPGAIQMEAARRRLVRSHQLSRLLQAKARNDVKRTLGALDPEVFLQGTMEGPLWGPTRPSRPSTTFFQGRPRPKPARHSGVQGGWS